VFAQALLAHAKKQVLDLQQAAEFSEQTHTQQLFEYKHTTERAHKEHVTSLTSAEANIRRLSAQLDELTQELLTQRELATDRQTRSKHTLDSLHAQLHTLEQTNHTLTTNYTTQTNALSAQVHTLTSEHTHLQQQLAQERTAHTLCKQTHEHVSAQLSTLINEKATIEAQLFNANLENNELKHQLESLRTQHTTLRHTHEQVSDALVCAQSEKQAIEHQSMEHTFKLNAAIDDLNAQLDECEQTLQQVRADRQAVIETHTQRVAELEEKLEAQSEATHTLTIQLRAQEQSLASMTAHTQVVQSDCERTHTELDCALTSVSTYQQENSLLTHKLAQLQADMAELAQERDGLSATNTQLTACVHTHESQLVECVDQWRACVQTDVGGDVSDTPTLFAHMLSAYKSVQANIHTLISELTTLTAHTATLANRHTEELLLLQEEMNQYTRESEQTRDVAKIFNPPHTLVLLTGDGNSNNDRVSFPEVILTAVRNDWNVEVWAWKAATSQVYKRFHDSYPSKVSLYDFDQYRSEVTYTLQKDDTVGSSSSSSSSATVTPLSSASASPNISPNAPTSFMPQKSRAPVHSHHTNQRSNAANSNPYASLASPDVSIGIGTDDGWKAANSNHKSKKKLLLPFPKLVFDLKIFCTSQQLLLIGMKTIEDVSEN
jgi:chromosome segregation ATPase